MEERSSRWSELRWVDDRGSSYDLLRFAVTKTIELQKVPDHKELETMLFRA